MCQKCVRSIPKAKIPLGKVKYFAHYLDTHRFADIPLFDRQTNKAIEGYYYLIRQAKTKNRT